MTHETFAVALKKLREINIVELIAIFLTHKLIVKNELVQIVRRKKAMRQNMLSASNLNKDCLL
ncbi:hypothetical protein C0W38_03435 [Photobacterium angustum]|nr:hypothetical protein UA33_03305 [Photobacterium angustum]KJG25245.1 hypothetical protein UA39_04665 [Photobacterium angustum]KJG33553.1 hypothetical protein UA36_00715 [Photobacterium angustum]PSW96044.1 hypothetical protein C0W79_08370 [Photobacterium angustum]PSX02821.1 hypothetical protein C0W87_06875 [Photobacterium angustum]